MFSLFFANRLRVFYKYIKILIIFLLAGFPVILFAQGNASLRWDDNTVFREDYRIDTSLHDQFYIRIKNTNFFKNNEYANEFKMGSSLSGLFLEPTIDYYASSQTRIRAGVHFLKYLICHSDGYLGHYKPVLYPQDGFWNPIH